MELNPFWSHSKATTPIALSNKLGIVNPSSGYGQAMWAWLLEYLLPSFIALAQSNVHSDEYTIKLFYISVVSVESVTDKFTASNG